MSPRERAVALGWVREGSGSACGWVARGSWREVAVTYQWGDWWYVPGWGRGVNAFTMWPTEDEALEHALLLLDVWLS